MVTGEVVTTTRDEVLRFRFRQHSLHQPGGSVTDPADVAILDHGVQDTGPDGAAWALAVRGLDLDHLDDRFALAWTLRGAPHAYRRADLRDVAVATAPFSEADAAKRVFDAAKPLKAAGIPALEALATVAGHMGAIVTTPTVKGEVSTALTERLDEPYLRWCRSCDASHAYEQPFRLSALQAGLVLDPDTSPPVLRRARGLKPLAFTVPGTEAAARFDVVRGYLRFFGPARQRDAAAYLDSPVKEVSAQWPDDTVAVEVRGDDGAGRSLLADDLDGLTAGSDGAAPTEPVVRLLGPFDPYLQLRDRELLVPDAGRRKELWPVLGRPGAIVADGAVVATWRPRSSGRSVTVQVRPWRRLQRNIRSLLEQEAERLAELRGVTLAGVVDAA